MKKYTENINIKYSSVQLLTMITCGYILVIKTNKLINTFGT